MAGMSQPGMLCLIKKKDFISSRPQGWRRNQNKLSNVDNEFTVMVNDTAFEGRDSFFEINSLDELEATRDLIMRKPIFITAKCKIPYDDTEEQDGYSWLEEEYVVLVNTANPEIAGQFDRAFQLAENYLKNGNNFRVSVCLSESIKAYYIANVHLQGQNNELITITGCDIYLTHGVKAPNCCDKCITCKTAPMKAIWVFCFPICLVTTVPYLCYKKCLVGLKEEKIKQVLPITLLQGPFETGYVLLSLLYAPAVNQQPGRY